VTENKELQAVGWEIQEAVLIGVFCLGSQMYLERKSCFSER
jgi:hypothetical protein